jgi:hypothetical protein
VDHLEPAAAGTPRAEEERARRRDRIVTTTEQIIEADGQH